MWRKLELLAVGVDHTECQFPVMVAAEIRVHTDISQIVVHKAHVPFQVKAQAALVQILGDQRKRCALLRDGQHAGIAFFQNGVQMLDHLQDTHGLSGFDGTCLYEHQDPRQGFHPHWGTLIYNYGRPQVSNYLIANALFWVEKFHADGIRMDAVASMLYLDYGKNDGEWVANIYGGKENLEAMEMIKHLNSVKPDRPWVSLGK